METRRLQTLCHKLIVLFLLLFSPFSIFGQTDSSTLVDSINQCLATGKYDEALNLLDQVIEANPDNVDLLFARGTIHEKIGSQKEAEKDYMKCLTIDPDNFNASYNLGVLYYNSAVHLLGKNPVVNSNSSSDRTGIAKEYLRLSLRCFNTAFEVSPAENKTTIEKMISSVSALIDPDNKPGAITPGERLSNKNISQDNSAGSKLIKETTRTESGNNGTIVGTVKEVEWTMNTSSWGSALLFRLVMEEYPDDSFYFRIMDYDKYSLIEFEGPKELGLVSPSPDLDEWKEIWVRITFTRITDKSRYPEKVLSDPAFYIDTLEKL